MIDEYPLLGKIDLDSPDHKIPRGWHRTARNGIFRGQEGNLRFESALGNTPVTNPYLPSSGINKTIGWHYDSVYYRLFVFNYNSNANHAIYVYYTQTQAWSIVLANGSSTNGDVLGFTTSYLTSIDIYYQEEGLGDILFYVDCLGRPTNLNITRYINNTYINIQRSFIDVAKAPPQMPPKCTYENDYTVSVNNLQNALFQFKERFVFDDNQKSVYSTGSEVPLPWQSQNYDLTGTATTYTNARIGIYIQTGDETVTYLEIWGRQVTDITAVVNNNAEPSPDYFLIASLNKSQLNIPNNSIYRFSFYNNGLYSYGDINEELQLFDYVPQIANCQALLNGDVPIYGGITEGYNNVAITAYGSASLVAAPPQYVVNGLMFLASCNGVDSGGEGTQITMYMSGVGVNDGSGAALTLQYETGGATIQYFVNVQLANGTSVSFSYNSSSSNIPTVLTGLGAAAAAQGFTVLGVPSNSTGGYQLTIANTSNVILTSTYLVFTPITGQSLQNSAFFCYVTKCAYDFAIQYYDLKGRTNGAQPFVGNPIVIPEDLTGTLMPLLQFNILNRPPTWAAYWQLLRSQNLTYSKRLEWISNQTFTNLDLNTNLEYAYIGISNMVDYDEDIEAATPVVSYQFQHGDRVRFEIQYPVGANPVTLTTGLDFQITSVVVDPLINGVTQIGTFIEIPYPTASISGNFNFGTDNFQNYKCLIYGIEQTNTAQNTVYYEFGKCFGVGNAGTSTAFHMGNLQSQTAALTQPAIVVTSDGDFFWRQRNVPSGLIYYLNLVSTSFPTSPETFWITPPNGTVINPQYTLQLQPSQPFSLFGPPPPLLFTNSTTTPIRLRLTWDMTVQCAGNSSSTIQVCGYTSNMPLNADGSLDFQYLIKTFYIALGENLAAYDLPVDGYLTVPANLGIWVIIYIVGSNVKNGAAQLKFQVLNNIYIPIIESSLSDKYSIITNSNSRPSVYDPNALQQYFSTLLRWGLAAQVGTNINQTNRFYPQDLDELDKSYGDIMRLRQRKRELRIFQYRRCGVMGVYNSFIKDNSGTNQLVVTNNIITVNNVQYYEGEYGIGNQPTSLISSGFVDYFFDPVKGFFCRLSLDGIVPISETNKIQTYAGTLTEYLQDYNYEWGGNSAIIGAFNFVKDRDSEAIFMMQGGTSSTFQTTTLSYYNPAPSGSYVFYMTGTPTVGYSIQVNMQSSGGAYLSINYMIQPGDTTTSIQLALLPLINYTGSAFEAIPAADGSGNQGLEISPTAGLQTATGTTSIYFSNYTINPESLAFVENGNKWSSFYDYAGDGIVCCENQIYTFNNGVLYIHNNSTFYCNYYGRQFQPTITLVKNDQPNIKKSWKSVNLISNVIWNCPSIYTEVFSYGMVQQQSNLIDEDFEYLEGGYSASFYRDTNSIGSLINGDDLKGSYLVMQLQVTNGPFFSYLANALVRYILSPVLMR
jgi:hypothetical protein